MPNKILDCSTSNSTICSASALLGVGTNHFQDILKNIGPIPDSENEEDYISQKIYSIVKKPTFPKKSLWFHASRVEQPDTFIKEGILTKNEIYDKIYKFLKNLTQGLKSYGEYPNELSVTGKSCINDEGPYAFLFKNVAIKTPGFNHSYSETPELVEDIAGVLLGENYTQLVSKFQSVTVPCIVTFLASIDEWSFNKVLRYAYLVAIGNKSLMAADAVKAYYNGYGLFVPPSDILKVEAL